MGSILLLLSSIVFAQTIMLDKPVVNAGVYVSLGSFMYENGMEQQALQVFLKGYELEPNNKFILNNLGYYYRDLNPIFAEEYFVKAIEIDQNYENALNNLAILYNNLQLYGRASDVLRKLVEIDSDNINYNYDLAVNLGQKYYKENGTYSDIIEAIKHFKIVYNLNPDFEHVLDNIQVMDQVKRVISTRQ